MCLCRLCFENVYTMASVGKAQLKYIVYIDTQNIGRHLATIEGTLPKLVLSIYHNCGQKEAGHVFLGSLW
jgi:hypothetical protein